jgi:FkbM family methyltransferase
MWFSYYRKTYKNFLSVIKNDLNSNYPFQAILQNGKSVLINSRDKAALYALLSIHRDFIYDENTDSIRFTYKTQNGEKEVILFGITQNLDAILVFSNNATYEHLPLVNKTIIDVGACTGDTAIYFALHDASKVIAIEPFPKNFEMAVKNIQTNNLDNKIKVVLGGCGNSTTIIINPSYQSSMRSVLHKSTTGIPVPIYTLEKILNEFNINDAILKMDCEGCEYETILNASKETLQRLSHIQIEYHNGYKNLKKKLEDCGFKVSKLFADNTKRGHILATRK